MKQTNYAEEWQTIHFDFEYVNENVLQVSNYGRVRSFNKNSDGNIISGSMTNGYKIIRIKFYTKRSEKAEKKLALMQKQVLKLARENKALALTNPGKAALKEAATALETLRKKTKKAFYDDVKSRTINYHGLIHRLVATYFLPAPKANQTLVAHLDHDKLNNRLHNLQWMTMEENLEHQKSSPHVIAENKRRKSADYVNAGSTKLTSTKVMLLKKLLNEGKDIRQLAKMFKVSDTQILRIKRGENWVHIKAAK